MAPNLPVENHFQPIEGDEAPFVARVNGVRNGGFPAVGNGEDNGVRNGGGHAADNEGIDIINEGEAIALGGAARVNGVGAVWLRRVDDEADRGVIIEEIEDDDEVEVLAIRGAPADPPERQPALPPAYQGPHPVNYGRGAFADPLFIDEMPEPARVPVQLNPVPEEEDAAPPHLVMGGYGELGQLAPEAVDLLLPVELMHLAPVFRREAAREGVAVEVYFRGIYYEFNDLRCFRSRYYRHQNDIFSTICGSCLFPYDYNFFEQCISHTLQRRYRTSSFECRRCGHALFVSRPAAECRYCLAAYLEGDNRSRARDGEVIEVREPML